MKQTIGICLLLVFAASNLVFAQEPAEEKKAKIVIMTDEDGDKTTTVIEGDEAFEWIEKHGDKDGNMVIDIDVDLEESGENEWTEDMVIKLKDLETEKGHEKKKMISISKDEDGNYVKTETVIEDGNETVTKKVMTEDEIKEMHTRHQIRHAQPGEEHEDVKVIIRKGKSDDAKVRVIKKMIFIELEEVKKEELEEVNKASSGQAGLDNSDPLDLKNLLFYPNPNDGQFTLSFDLENTKKPATIKIFNLQGEEIYNEKVSGDSPKYNKEIDLSTEAKGVYFLSITQGKKQDVRKVVLQ